MWDTHYIYDDKSDTNKCLVWIIEVVKRDFAAIDLQEILQFGTFSLNNFLLTKN